MCKFLSHVDDDPSLSLIDRTSCPLQGDNPYHCALAAFPIHSWFVHAPISSDQPRDINSVKRICTNDCARILVISILIYLRQTTSATWHNSADLGQAYPQFLLNLSTIKLRSRFHQSNGSKARVLEFVRIACTEAASSS